MGRGFDFSLASKGAYYGSRGVAIWEIFEFLGLQWRLLRLPGVAIWTIFEFLGGLVISSSYQVESSTYLKSYRYLWIYTEKAFSSCAVVWAVSCSSMASITLLRLPSWSYVLKFALGDADVKGFERLLLAPRLQHGATCGLAERSQSYVYSMWLQGVCV